MQSNGGDRGLAARLQDLAICLTIIVAALVVYWQTTGFDFVRFDDPLTALNPHAAHGFTVEALKWAFSMDDSNWLPLTRLSHILDRALFGTRSGPMHAENVLLHITASTTVFLWLLRATGARWPSAFSGLLFAVHPLHVESAAWIAERKDVLCAAFWFLTLWEWTAYARTPRRSGYIRALLFFCLALASKPMAVTLPIAMILLDFWPLRRPISAATLGEKAPFAVLALAVSFATYFAQRAGGAVKSFDIVSPALRIGNALVSWVVYPLKTIWPADLAVGYPYPKEISISVAAACGLAVAAATFLAIRLRTRIPYLTTGWFWYLSTTLPVIGLIQVGMQARADRYMYIPMVGLAIPVAWGVGDLVRRLPAARVPVCAAGLVSCAALILSARVQTAYWRNSESLFRRAIAVTQGNYVAYQNLGSTLAHIPGHLKDAISSFEAAVRIRPLSSESHSSLCAALQSAGRLSEALRECEIALKLNPGNWEGHIDRGVTLGSLGRTAEAIGEYRVAILLRPASPEAHGNLGMALSSSGQLTDALAEFDAVLRLDAGAAWAHYHKGLALLDLGNAQAAVEEFEAALDLEPANAAIHNVLGTALLRVPGGALEALQEFGTAVRLNPGLPEAHANLAVSLSETGRLDAAVAEMRKAVQIRPDTKWTDLLGKLEKEARETH